MTVIKIINSPTTLGDLQYGEFFRLEGAVYIKLNNGGAHDDCCVCKLITGGFRDINYTKEVERLVLKEATFERVT